MKKAIILSCSIILAIVILFFSLYFVAAIPKNAGNFSVDKFNAYIHNEQFQTDKNYGKITDYMSAAAAGKAAISDRFENTDSQFFK